MNSPFYGNVSKPHLYWIHCNICYKQYIQKEARFYLMACHHVVCNSCIVEVLHQPVNGPLAYKCAVCKKITRACEINNTMPKHLKELFHPEPYLDGLNTFNIMTFQEKHRQRFLEYMNRQEARQAREQEEIAESIERARRLYQEYEQLKAERRHWENMYMLQRRREVGDNRSTSSSSGYSSEGSY